MKALNGKVTVDQNRRILDFLELLPKVGVALFPLWGGIFTIMCCSLQICYGAHTTIEVFHTMPSNDSNLLTFLTKNAINVKNESSSSEVDKKIILDSSTFKDQPKASKRVSTVSDFEIVNRIAPMNFQPLPSTLNQQFHWIDGAVKPQTVGSRWYGFNHYFQRSARNLALHNKLRNAANLMGESTHMFPTVNFYPNHQFHLEKNLRFHPPMNDLQSLGTVPNQNHFQQTMFQQVPPKIPRGVLIPVIRPRPNQAFFERPPHQQSFNYRRQASENVQRSAASPTPVTIKIVPLKLSSIDLANALKSMSWIPISLDMLKLNGIQNTNQNVDEKPYSDKRQSMFDDDNDNDDDSDLPPPSSHVATPPLGITYAEGRRHELYLNRVQPRK
ncbi:uncharacterized protein CEXT_497721 [Caerostris extrusa]|uniref:Uncharacterized protein n=1 Tax=Caerostris extrusa TaxID=172846 RepID=A0AAV4XSC0_CAEEX|nr:uncharacterized protein CEXT_497721 [Caerostris extrusa]